ncbi:MAG: glycosyltransferase [Bdellovibrionales bacterium]|nr:glycosyltransferase [Bdellovibrionales bacterium]
MRIAICGTRGIPACYGGFETFAEELSIRLVKRGHEVRVYGRKHVIDYDEPTYQGVEICLLPAPRHKYFETPVHSLISFFHLLFHRVDVVLVCNAANSPFVWLLRLAGLPVAVNVDGIERRRAKWNFVGRLWYWLGERCSVWFATRIVADADVIAEYYREQYGADSSVIRYGYSLTAEAAAQSKADGDGKHLDFLNENPLFSELGIRVDSYILFVSRLEPENNAHVVIDAFNGLPEELRRRCPLLVVGDAPYAREYIDSLHQMACDEVVFAGYRFREAYIALQLGAAIYVQATEVGGTHPALVEAMGFANCIVVNGTPENTEVIGDAGHVYSKNDSQMLRRTFSRLLSDVDSIGASRRAARTRAKQLFSWDNITSDYERLFESLRCSSRGVPAAHSDQATDTAQR